MIRILTDSTSDISDELCESQGIEKIPMYIHLNGNTYKDGDEIQAQTLFDQVKETGQYPTTSAPPPGDFIRFFEQQTPAIYVSVSGSLSTTFKNAQLARKELCNRAIDLIDSRSISTGYGQIVLQAADWRNEGMGFKELGRRIRRLVQKSRGIFILDTLDYLYHGGRCSAIQHFVSSVLKIHPFLNIKPDGTLGILQKVRGSRLRALKALLLYFKEHFNEIDLRRVIITHLNCDDEADFLADQLKGMGFPGEIMMAKVGCVLASHSGPYPIGIAYQVK